MNEQMQQMARKSTDAPKPKCDAIMLDMETLATRADAVILSIGAVKFQTTTDYIDDGAFYAILKLDGQMGRHISPDTLSWWISQDAKAKAIFNASDKLGIGQALGELSKWSDDEFRTLWANGADFDIPMILHALDTHGYRPMVRYYNHRCYRTMKNEYTMVPQPDRDGIAHNALHDAMHQARHLQAIYKYRRDSIIDVTTKGFTSSPK